MQAVARQRSPLAVSIASRLRSRDCRCSLADPAVVATVSALALGFASAVHAGSTFIVNTTGDPGPGGTTSLRQAITSANAAAGNTVQFDAALVGSTITLAGSEILVSKPMSITGPGAGRLTISGNGASRIFRMEGCGSTDRVYLSGVTLTNASSAFTGGAVLLFGCDLKLIDSKITASHSQNIGGAVYSYGRSLILEGSTISGNSAAYGGGIGIGLNGVAVIGHSSIRGNSAAYRGGGIFQLGGYLELDYATISGNVIPAPPGPYLQGGGGVFIAGNARFIAYVSTIANNYAYAGGGGIATFGSYAGDHATIFAATIAGNSTCCYETGNGIVASAGKPSLSSVIVANNFNRAGIYDLAGSFEVNSSLVRNAGSATVTGTGSIFGVDPKLGPLRDNGGPTFTMLPATDSPAIDAVASCVGPTVLDQRLQPRCANSHIDIGAVERQNPEDFIFRDGYEPQ